MEGRSSQSKWGNQTCISSSWSCMLARWPRRRRRVRATREGGSTRPGSRSWTRCRRRCRDSRQLPDAHPAASWSNRRSPGFSGFYWDFLALWNSIPSQSSLWSCILWSSRTPGGPGEPHEDLRKLEKVRKTRTNLKKTLNKCQGGRGTGGRGTRGRGTGIRY